MSTNTTCDACKKTIRESNGLNQENKISPEEGILSSITLRAGQNEISFDLCLGCFRGIRSTIGIAVGLDIPVIRKIIPTPSER